MSTIHRQPSPSPLRMEEMSSENTLLPLHDYDCQLTAIRTLLQKHSQFEQLRNAEMVEMEQRALRNEMASDNGVDAMHAAVYQDAAHSMAAVGMLAPLVESIFYQAFLNIGTHFENKTGPLENHGRLELPPDDQWNCHIYWEKKKGQRKENLALGILQLSTAVGLKPDLPKNINSTLEALFAYRNKMFHSGFEWPIEDRKEFRKRIDKNKWGDYFSAATMNGAPWIYYLNDTFIFKCLEQIEIILRAIKAFAGKLDADSLKTR